VTFLKNRFPTVVLVALFAAAALAPAPAQALFGLFEGKPEPKPDAVPYVVDYEAGDDKAVVQILKDNSTLERLKDDAPADGESLARRAEIDAGKLTDALWGEGYYNGTVEVLVAGRRVRTGEVAAAASAAAAMKGVEVVPIAIRATPGERFTLRNVAVITPAGARLDDVPARELGLSPGDPARAESVRAAQGRVVDFYREQSRPLTKPVDILATVDHAGKTMDATIVVAPGAVAPIGEISVSGAPGVDPAVIRSYVYAEPGDAYSPQAMASMRKSVLRIQALSSARVVEAETLDAQGRLPVMVDVTERARRLIGGSVRVSTLDGPALRAYWEHRNLFGGAEYLRLEADGAMLPRWEGDKIRSLKDIKWSDFGGRLQATFIKPALGGTRNDFVASAMAERARTGGGRFGGYENETIRFDAGIRHRFSDTFSVQAGLAYEAGWTKDALGKVDYRLIGAPFNLKYDSTDNPLNATQGVKVIASATPWYSLDGAKKSFFETRIAGSTYVALDPDAKYVLAGRLAFGSILGAGLRDIPANHRFYAGGGASVRGYRYQSLGPRLPNGYVVGGSSLLEASLEARIKVTNNIGIVPFVDAGSAFASSYPDFKENVHYSAGLGLRYHTAIGPIRLDVAFPLNRRKGDRPVALYFGIGQAF
jgi:translocation and assembly module TamA